MNDYLLRSKIVYQMIQLIFYCFRHPLTFSVLQLFLHCCFLKMALAIVSGIKSTVIEPYMFFMTLGFAVTLVPLDQLQQDKICLTQYHQSSDYCINFSKSPTSVTKLAILASSSLFSMKVSIIDTLPAIFWCLMIGSVCDRFPKTRKYFMILTAVSVILRDVLVLFNLIFFDTWGEFDGHNSKFVV